MKRSVGKISYDDNTGEGKLEISKDFLAQENTLMIADVLQDLVYQIGKAYADSVSNCDVLGKPGCSYTFQFVVHEKNDQTIN